VKAVAPSPSPVTHRAALVALTLLLALPARGWTWGGATHHYIAQNYSKHLPAYIDGLKAYDSVVDAHVNDPDIRRPSTPGEEFRHYIDIDSYPEFLAGAMPHDRAALEAQYGAATVENIGIVPWAVAEVVATLTQQFQAQQWSAAALTIADLCHYVGDSTQPLHCTKNYNGQLSGNTGIHSRYESTMMSGHIADLSTPVMAVADYASPVDAMFGIVSGSWDRVNAVLQADNTAKAASGGSFNSVYYTSLWNSTQSFTRVRIDSATVATASFVYTAWVNAGRPVVPGSTAGVEPTPVAGVWLEAGPTPFRDALTIRFSGRGPMKVDVFDVRGARVERVLGGAAAEGSTAWRPAGDVAPGLYFVRLTGPGVDLVRRVTRIR
jgi:hypothetical protein